MPFMRSPPVPGNGTRHGAPVFARTLLRACAYYPPHSQADKIWSQILDLDRANAAAWSNRGNCRTSVGKDTLLFCTLLRGYRI